MVLQQCLACNLLITGISKSCVCGHVFEDTTLHIGGKRYSEYRAMLYSRLEFKRKKREARENKKPKTHQQGPSMKHKEQMAVTTKKSHFKPARRRTVGKRTPAKGKIGRTSSTIVKQHPAHSAEVPKELLSRFPSALKEINRRLLGQNMVWITLCS
ncbi:uncharacterized protein LOC111321958 [Stylophora pistillata]|uniref:uncharacterized protein LOC111321958 n=1 Tax=Stylophora pistillata TaxID=50429 RepID=UPI000C03A1E1|nr:uncharacterized protein LOC111321958 [Stylophora pistillata]